MPRPRLAIVTALKEELAAVQAAIPKAEQNDIVLVRGGVGGDSAAKAAKSLISPPGPPMMICVTGFCGGLNDSLKLGDVFIPDAICGMEVGEIYRIVRDGPELGGRSFGVVLNAMRVALGDAGLKPQSGTLLTTRGAITDCKQKRELGTSKKAIAVDMETYAVTMEAGTRAPVFAIRVVSDCVDDELPSEVGEFLDESGGVRVSKVARFAIRSTQNMRTLWQLKSRTDKALANLTAAWKAIWPVLRTARIEE